MEGYGPASYGDGFADVYDVWYADVSPPDHTAAFVARRATGLVVELGSGTGRLAGPMWDAGLPVVGLDASGAMLRRSVARFPSIPVVVADMAEPALRAACAGGVLVAFNTLFNLPTAAGQRRALEQATALLAPGGVVIVEAFVPDETATTGVIEDRVEVTRLEADRVVLRISRTDHAARTVSGHHVELRDGAPVRLRPWHLHFVAPEGLDRMATAAGLVLDERYADWSERPFVDASPMHVSVYRAANGQQ